MAWLSMISVHYTDHGDDKPGNTMQVIDDKNADINAGFGGKFVWLVPTFNSNEERAISSLRIDIQDHAEDGRSDLAKGAGGKYRYLAWRTDGAAKITEIRLLRSAEQVEWERVRDLGFDDWTSDINAGRGGDYLYLVWKY